MPYKDPEKKKAQMKVWNDANREWKRQYARDYAEAHKEERKDKSFRRQYGIGLKDLEERLKAQGGLCAVCREEPAVHVDHKHGTKTMRGILCAGCNVGLGHFKESIQRLENAIRYLKETS